MAESLQLLGTVVPPGQAETMSETLLGMPPGDLSQVMFFDICLTSFILNLLFYRD